MDKMVDDCITLQLRKEKIEGKIIKSINGPDGIALQMPNAYLIYDPGYIATASCKSKITFIDGEKGILRHCGYEILEIVKTKDYLSIVYLLLNGEFPNKVQESEFKSRLEGAANLPQNVIDNICSFPKNTHPMTILVSAFAALAANNEKNYFDIYKELLIANIPTIVAYIYRHISGVALIKPHHGLSYTENFLYMMFGLNNKEHAKVLDTIFILHADHEQNASTSTARMTTSSGANPILAVSAATATLSGPLHGGANEAVIKMLERIQNGNTSVEEFIEAVKLKKEKLMGFGHRVYKNYDPRAIALSEIAKNILKDQTSDLFQIAKKLENAALQDEYFVSRKLYPNVDFYSGIILKAIGIPMNMFTPIFALARTSGWVAQINEMLKDEEQKISRPRQIYIGENLRNMTN